MVKKVRVSMVSMNPIINNMNRDQLYRRITMIQELFESGQYGEGMRELELLRQEIHGINTRKY